MITELISGGSAQDLRSAADPRARPARSRRRQGREERAKEARKEAPKKSPKQGPRKKTSFFLLFFLFTDPDFIASASGHFFAYFSARHLCGVEKQHYISSIMYAGVGHAHVAAGPVYILRSCIL